MPNTFFCSDHHFGHEKIITFKNKDGLVIRNFSSIEEHDEYIIARHNEVVGQQDKVYFLGDVVIKQKNLSIISRMNGHKRLVRGNHDIFNTTEYMKAGFREVYGVRVFTPKEALGEFMVASHVPLHPSSLDRWAFNVHGHLHSNYVQSTAFTNERDYRYFNVSLEALDDYKPVEMSAIVARMRELLARNLI